MVYEVRSRQQHQLHYSQTCPDARQGSPREIGIPLVGEIYNFVQLLVLEWHHPVYRQVAGKA